MEEPYLNQEELNDEIRDMRYFIKMRQSKFQKIALNYPYKFNYQEVLVNNKVIKNPVNALKTVPKFNETINSFTQISEKELDVDFVFS